MTVDFFQACPFHSIHFNDCIAVRRGQIGGLYGDIAVYRNITGKHIAL